MLAVVEWRVIRSRGEEALWAAGYGVLEVLESGHEAEDGLVVGHFCFYLDLFASDIQGTVL